MTVTHGFLSAALAKSVATYQNPNPVIARTFTVAELVEVLVAVFGG